MNRQRLNALTFLFGISLMVGIWSIPAQADVTGDFTTHIVVMPSGDQTPSSEIGMLEFDLQNELNIRLILSGLSTTIHSHLGLAGVEDIQLTYAATLGALDINGTFVFGRFTGICVLNLDSDEACEEVQNNPHPLSNNLLFVKKRVKTSISFGGVSLVNLALFEDVNWPETLNPTSHQTSDQQFAFGDIMAISGQTTSGISIEAQSGICADATVNAIKKHTWTFSVVPGCHQEPKPDLLYTYERLTINGIPIAPSITGKAIVECIQVQACELSQTILVSGGIVPLSATFTIKDLFTFEFGTATLTFTSGSGSLSLTLDNTGGIDSISITLAPTINPDTNPATLVVDGTVEPGVGLVGGSIGIEVTREFVTFEANAEFEDGPPATFSGVEFGVNAVIDLLEIEATLTYLPGQMVTIESFWTVNF